MAIVTTNDQHYSDIADAIRAKGVNGVFKPAQMAGAISNIPTGGGGVDLAGVEAYIANYLFETPTIVKGALNSYRGYISGI